MKREFMAKRLTCCAMASVLCVASLAGCGKKNTTVAADNVGNVIKEETEKVDKCIFKQEKIEGITKEGEYLEYFDIAGDRIVSVAHEEGGKSRYISFKTDGSDVQSYELAGDGNSISSVYTTDKDGNLYMLCKMYSEIESTDQEEEDGVAHAGDDESDDAANNEGSVGASYGLSEASLIKLDNAGKELFKVDLCKDFPENDPESISGMVWTQKNGLLLNTTQGIINYDEKNGFNTVMGLSDFGDSYEGYCTLFKGKNDQLFAFAYSASKEGYACYKVDLDNKKISEPIIAFSDNYYDFFYGDGYDFYASDTEALYGYDDKSGQKVKVVDFAESNITPDVAGIVLRKAIILNDKEIVADISGGSDFTANICKLVKE